MALKFDHGQWSPDKDATDDETRINGGLIEQEDRLSSLPDPILVSILSLLPTKTAVSTGVLSRQWRHLWTHVSSLKLDVDNYKVFKRHGFFAVVDRLLRELLSPKLDEFHLNIPQFPCRQGRNGSDEFEQYVTECKNNLNSLIPQVCSRNVKSIVLGINDSYCEIMSPTLVPLPPVLFATQSLVELVLCRCCQYSLPDNGVISLPNLKKLHLELWNYNAVLSKKLIKSCPSLEDLFFQEKGYRLVKHKHEDFLDISAPCLKRLRLVRTGCVCNKVVINAPALEVIEIHDESLTIYTLMERPNALVHAKISVHTNHYEYHGGSLVYNSQTSNLLRSMSNVTTLDLSGNINEYLPLGVGLSPLFHNLKSLSVSFSLVIRCSLKRIQFIMISSISPILFM